jgi:hypothetical protein
MTIYRRFVRAKKGMSTIFGGLFFIILILMGFNLMLWGFIQYDNYNSTLFKMNQNDQLAASENLVPTNPGAQNFTSTGFNIPVNNLGGTTVSIARIYISNLSPTGGIKCTNADPNSQGPCIVDPGAGTQNCAGIGNCYFTNGNVAAGVINQLIHVRGVTLNDGSGYKVVLSSTRGRLFSFFYPWPVTNVGNNPGGNFVTNIGPLSIYFNYQSFNFTQGFQTSSQPAFCVPQSTAMVFWLKIANNAQDSAVTLKSTSVIEFKGYGVTGAGLVVDDFIDNQTTISPGLGIIPYNDAQPTVLPPAPANGAATLTTIKFSASSPSGSDAGSLPKSANYITFIGFYYAYRTDPVTGQPLLQGETIPFIDLKVTSGYPGSC